MSRNAAKRANARLNHLITIKTQNKMRISNDTLQFGKPLRNDNIYPEVSVVGVAQSTGLQSRQGIDQFVIVDGTIQNTVSFDYGLLPNKDFFGVVEQKLDDAGIAYMTNRVNRRNRNFAVDYILDDSSLHINIKGAGKDKIRPAMRFQTSYDGSLQTEGFFGLFREVCSNQLHVAQMQVGFKLRHRANLIELVLPKIEETIAQFMDNEFFSLHKKFEVLAERSLRNEAEIENFVKWVCDKSSLFKYVKSEKNPEEPSKRAQLVMDTINAEAKALGTGANLWLGYNAFNEYIHGETNKDFRLQANADKRMFNLVLQYAEQN